MYNNDDKKDSESTDFDYYPTSGRSSKKIWIIAIGFLLIAVAVLYIAIYNPGIFKKHKPAIVATEATKSDSAQTVIPDSLAYHPSDYASLNIPSKDDKFHIIAGVFVIEKNANNYMDVLKGKGFDPKILLKRGEYNFISIFSCATFKEATSKYRSIDGIPVWIMKY
jgi:hypothetical protein